MKNYTKAIAMTALVAAGLALTAPSSRADISLSFHANGGSQVNFDGAGNFTFTAPVAGKNFQVDSSSSVLQDAVGDFGLISGSFSIGTITTLLGTSTANVSGVGAFSITGGGDTLTGTLTWKTITQTGGSSALNIAGVINVTGITYGGTQSDLQALKGDGLASSIVNFTFTPPVNLATLQSSAHHTSFSGTVSSAVPEPTTVVAGVLMLLPFGIGAIRSLRKDRAA